jgi:putative membrane protein
VKAASVLLLSAIHGFYGRLLRDFANDRNTRSARFFRSINEIPFLIAIVIVIMVIVKPF